jgi:DNA polymerase
MFVGEAPGHNEDISGEPFVGSAGKLLTSLLNEIQMSRESVYITNIVKCRPPNNRDPHPNEITLCEPYLDAQISIVDPVLILPLGRFAMNYFIPGESITRISGTVQKIQGRYVYPLLHPAAALRRTEYKQRLRNDFLNIPSAVDRISLLSKGMDFGSFDQMRLT